MSHASHLPTEGVHDHTHAVHGVGKYIAVFVALCFLTGCSFLTYSDLWPFHKTPEVAWVFMTAVSCTKAMLVILFFMHVKYEANWKYVLTIPASIMAIFLTLALVPDVGARVNGLFGFGGKYSAERREYAADQHDQKLMLELSGKVEGHGEHGE
ncbi:MAG TPA: cytochrome C oxidase subunit IV family protein [Pirellulales bacterium]|jgi:cytochrome c oxidase subunit 4|nr:cytochrome C oxidase subunit IV family protein [Pirellulales bacterium]